MIIIKERILDKTELRKLSETMDVLEKQFKYPYKHVSGCFAESVMYDYDDEYIYVEVKSGIQSDVDNSVYIDNIKINRETMKPVDDES